jgi:hypothetical protein
LLTYKGKKVRGPKALVDYFYDKINYKVAFLVVLIAIILELFFYVAVLKIPQAATISLLIIYSRLFVSWILLGIIIYLFAYLIRSKQKMPKRALEKILSVLASIRMPMMLFYIIFGVIGFIFLGNYVPVLQNVAQNPDLLLSTTAFPALTTLNVIGLVILGLVGLVFLVYFFFILYYIVKKIFNTKSFVITLVYLILLIFLSGFVTFLFGV